MTLWRSLMVWLASLAADPAIVAEEQPRCAAAVAAAYATFAPAEEPPAPPAPPPKPAKCKCNGTKVWKPDGTVVQPCPCGDKCVCEGAR